MGAVCGRWWPIPSGLGRVWVQSQRPPAGTSLQRSRELRGDWLAAGRGVSGPPPGPPGAHTAPVEWCVPHSSQASWGGDSRTSEEWRDEAQPSWVRRLGPSQLSLPTALGGGDPLEFRFRLLWLRAGGESGAGAQLVLRLCAFPLGVTRACCCSGGCAAPDSPPGDGAACGRLHPPPTLTRVLNPWPPRRRPHRTSWREAAAPHRPPRRPAPGGSRARPVRAQRRAGAVEARDPGTSDGTVGGWGRLPRSPEVASGEKGQWLGTGVTEHFRFWRIPS